MSAAASAWQAGARRFGGWRARLSGAAPLDALAAAGTDDVLVQMSLADAYLHGRSVPPSTETAAHWYTRAADAGNAGAMLQLAKLALAGDLPEPEGHAMFTAPAVRMQPDGARRWAERAVATGSEEAKVVLAALLGRGPPEWQDQPAARTLLEEAAEAGSAAAALSLAVQHAQDRSSDPQTIAGLLQTGAEGGLPAAAYLYGVVKETGAGCARDADAAVSLYRLAAEAGHVWAQARLGQALIAGSLVEQNVLHGETWLRMAAKAGNGPAAALLGDHYARASGHTNYLEAGHWFLRAAELGDAPSARIASFFHATGTGLHEDRRDAASCLQRAETLAASVAAAGAGADPAILVAGDRADLRRGIAVRAWFTPLAGSGDLRAAYRLGACFAMGIGGRKDYGRAAEWLFRAAAHIPAAQLLYGQLLLDPANPHCDPAAGRSWIQRAAWLGFPDACVALAELLASGRGGAQDRSLALDLFTAAAARGHRGAMYAAGALHGGGHGIAPDHIVAQRWFRRAAEAGHARAQMMLGRYLARGTAGDRDRVAAATWLRRAIGNGIAEARGDLAALAPSG